MKKVFIVWGRELQLSKNIADALNIELKQFYFKKNSILSRLVFLRYIAQGLTTLIYLFKNRPEIVLVQNPPVFAPVTVLFYCWLSGAKMAIDSHTAAFLDKKWRLFFFLFKFVARRSIVNTCHNYKNLEILKNWNISPAMVMQFYNPVYKEDALKQPLLDNHLNVFLKNSKYPIIMVNRFANDDDYKTVIKTAEMMFDYTFFITGNTEECKEKLIIEKAPNNVCFTGYLKHGEFLKLMWRCRVVLAFTLRKDTVLWSVREIMALNKPFVTTDSDVLRHYYGEVGMFVKSNPVELKKQIELALEKENKIKNNIENFLEKDNRRWDREISEFQKFLA